MKKKQSDFLELCRKNPIVHNPNLKPMPLSENGKAKMKFMQDLIDKYGLPKHIEERNRREKELKQIKQP